MNLMMLLVELGRLQIINIIFLFENHAKGLALSGKPFTFLFWISFFILRRNEKEKETKIKFDGRTV